MSENVRKPASLLTGLALVLPATLPAMAVVLLIPILPTLIQQFQGVAAANYWVPMILTMPALCVALFSPLAGLLGDRFDRRKLLLLSLFGYAVVGTAPLYLSSFWTILASRFGVGVTEAMLVTLSTTMIADYFEGEARNRWLAGQTAVASVSALLFFPLGGFLGEFSWRAPFLSYFSAFAMMALVALFTWKMEPDTTKATPAIARGGSLPFGHLSRVVPISIFASVLFYALLIQTSPGLTLFGVTEPARIGMFTALAGIGVPFGTFVYSRFSRRGDRLLLAVAFGLVAAGMAIMGIAGTATAFVGGSALAQIGAGMLLPTLLVWAVSNVRFEQRARVAGLFTAAFAFGQWLSSIVLTLLGSWTGGLLSSLVVLAVSAMIAAALAASASMHAGRTRLA